MIALNSPYGSLGPPGSGIFLPFRNTYLLGSAERHVVGEVRVLHGASALPKNFCTALLVVFRPYGNSGPAAAGTPRRAGLAGRPHPRERADEPWIAG